MSIWMYLVLFVYVIACLFLIFVILVQSGKGGGLSSLAGASSGLQEALGSTAGERTLNRLTYGAAGAFVLLAIILALGAQGGRNVLTNPAPTEANVPSDATSTGIGDLPAATTAAPTATEGAPAATEAVPAAPAAQDLGQGDPAAVEPAPAAPENQLPETAPAPAQ
jgi:preprotein translocase subunit SecG